MSRQKPAADPIQGAKRFGDKDMLQHIDLARFLFSKPIPVCREAHNEITVTSDRTGAK